MEYQDNAGQDTFKLYYVNRDLQNGYKFYLARSIDYGITWTDKQSVNVLSDDVIIKNQDSSKFYQADGDWVNQISYMIKGESNDGGFNFLYPDSVMELGEDKSFIWNEDEHEYWGYVRPFPTQNECCFDIYRPCPDGVRKIALMKNGNYFGSSSFWSARNIIVEIDTLDYIDDTSPDYRTQIYYMQAFRSGDDWWGLVGMYRVGNNGGLTNDPPYTYPEYTSDVELMWSDDGEDWYRTNNHQPFIALHDSIRSIYTVGTIVGDSVYFYSSESTILHATHKIGGCEGVKQDSMVNGKYFSIFLYKMGIEKLNEWRPPSVVNINCTVQGFFNSVSGKHNIIDTLSAQLRNSTSPYGIASTVKSVIDSVTFQGNFNFPHVTPANYYLAIYGRNSLETWSANTISISNGSESDYDFTDSYLKAYGGNLDSLGKFCIFSGDVVKDGFIDINDVTQIVDDAVNYLTGYVDSDLNGDYIVDNSDSAIAENNSTNFVSVIKP
ncbi:MAG: hypothetical protein JSS91_01665 [Bacteroidetes bacterium]|nr:hypothetical protein [Bacteroidota bacterium]